MHQETLNVLMVFYLPAIVGVVFRVLAGGRKKDSLITVIGILAACVMWGIAYYVNTGGSEAYGLYAMVLTCFAAGSILGEAYFFVRKLMRKFRKR